MVNAGDTLRYSIRGLCFGQQIIMDLSYYCSVGNGVLTTAQVLAEFNAQLAAGGANDVLINYRGALPPQYTLLETRAQIIKPVRSGFNSLFFVGVTGTNVNPATVACDSAAIVRRTALAGRKEVSTLKIGPAPDGASAAGVLTAAYTGLAALFGLDTIKAILLPVSTCQFLPSILDQAGFDTNRRLTNMFVEPESRVMRRRVVGRGK